MFNLALLSGSKGGVVTPGVAASAFLARTSGLDALHTNMYATLINGLVSDGVWSKLDALYFMATKDSTTATLNLVSSSFTLVPAGSPTWTADQGYTGTAASTTVGINTAFNPSTAGGNFTQNSAHISVWSNTSLAANTNVISGAVNTTITAGTAMYPIFTGNLAFFRINENQSSGSAANASSVGHFLENRDSGTTQQGYINGTNVSIASQVASTAMVNSVIYLLCYLKNGAISNGWGGQISCASLGGSLTATDVSNLKTRLGTARTTVGLP